MKRYQCENCTNCLELYPLQRMLGSRSMRQCKIAKKTRDGNYRCIAKMKNCPLKEKPEFKNVKTVRLKFNKPVWRHKTSTIIELICPYCKTVLASGYYLGITITPEENCPECEKELDWSEIIK